MFILKGFKKTLWTSTMLMFTPTVFANAIGVIPDTNSCPNDSEPITIYMDDEDSDNASSLTGWVGATTDATRFTFCRVNGDGFLPLSNNENYAVLKLDDTCPNNSIEFSRYFDNEDNRNNNQSTGNISPNQSTNNTLLKFCYFKGRANGISAFPSIGINYGVFSPTNFALSVESGQILTDDEDTNNNNQLDTNGHPEITSIISSGTSGKNTILRVNKVKTFKYPADSKFIEINTQNLQRPAYLDSYIEPNFATRVTRISERERNDDSKHPSTKSGSAWNNDMSILKMHYALYDAKTLERKSPQKKDSTDYNKLGTPMDSDIRWSKINAHTLYTLTPRKKLTKVVLNEQYTDSAIETLHDFSQEYEKISFGNGEGELDNNDKIVLSAKKVNSDTVYAILYDLQTNQRIWTHVIPDVQWGSTFDWVSLSPRGNYIVVNTAPPRSKQTELGYGKIYGYDNNLKNQRELDVIGEHGDLGIDQQGNEVYVQFHTEGKSENTSAEVGVWSINLATGEKTRLLDQAYGGGHISCQNYKRPGWCYVSSRKEGHREVFALKLDKTKTVQRYAQTHATYQAFPSLINVSPNGTEVVFATDWEIEKGTVKKDTGDTYLVQIPQD